MARDNMELKFKNKSQTLKDDLEKILSMMPEEEDWYYSAAVRLEGAGLMRRGGELEEDRKTLETEAAVKVHKIEADLSGYIKEREEELQRERKTFEAKVAQQNDRINLDIEIRKEELEKTKDVKKKEFNVIEKKAREELGAAPTEMTQDHRNQLLAIDDLVLSESTALEKYRVEEEKEARLMFDRAELNKMSEIERRKAQAGGNIARIREEVAEKVRSAESEWQNSANRWLVIGKKKVQIKKKEDDDAREGKKKRKGGK